MTPQTDTTVPGYIRRIPVRNIWLLLYASQLYRELPEARRVDLENAPDDIPDLVAEILANAVERRLRRNLTAGYLDPNRARKTAPLANAGWADFHERRMLASAQLALNLHIPTEQAGRSPLPVSDRRERRGWQLYEDAVAGFCDARISYQAWRVRSQSGIARPLESPTSAS